MVRRTFSSVCAVETYLRPAQHLDDGFHHFAILVAFRIRFLGGKGKVQYSVSASQYQALLNLDLGVVGDGPTVLAAYTVPLSLV